MTDNVIQFVSKANPNREHAVSDDFRRLLDDMFGKPKGPDMTHEPTARLFTAPDGDCA